MPTSRRIVDSSGEDFYPTPAWATSALLANETFHGSIWEPACGNGAMSEVLLETGCSVYSSDLHDRGYGSNGIDFTDGNYLPVHNIITNPPYNLAEEFVSVGLKLATFKLALLLRLSFLESAKRFRTIFKPVPPARVWVFSERITFYPNGLQTAGSGTLAYAWFVWDKEDQFAKTQLRWIPPGFKTSNQSEAVEIEL